MKLTRLLDIAGTDVAGVRADIRSRHADGSLDYMFPGSHTRPEHEYIVEMSAVTVYTDSGTDWVSWTYSGFGSGRCGTAVAYAQDLHLLMDLPEYSEAQP
jgi:hypothetical protein